MSYEYEVGGVSQVSGRCAAVAGGVREYAVVQRLLLAYPAGSDGSCYVDPGDPSRAVLRQQVPWEALGFAAAALLVGGGLWVSLAAARAARSGSRVSGQASAHEVPPDVVGRQTQRAHALVLCLFSAGFFTGVLPLVTLPALRALDARRWQPVPCRILHSDVHLGSTGKKGTQLDILYGYAVAGTGYQSNRLGPVDEFLLTRADRHELLDRFPVGTTSTCYVNPGDPVEAVLTRELGPSHLVFLLAPPFFLLGSLYCLCHLAVSGFAAEAEAFGRRPQSDARTAFLRRRASPVLGFLVSAFGALGYNLLVSFFLRALVQEWINGERDPVFACVCAVMVIAGVVLLLVALRHLRRLLRVPPFVWLSPAILHPGGTGGVRWRVLGRADRLRRVRITLEARQPSSRDQESRSLADEYAVVARVPVANTTNPDELADGDREFRLPGGAPPSEEHGLQGGVHWVLRVAVEKTRGGVHEEEYAVTVDAATGAARS